MAGTGAHLRIRLQRFEMRGSGVEVAWRAVRSLVAALPRRYPLHGLVLGVALAVAAAHAGT
jgi:hypothetical protein